MIQNRFFIVIAFIATLLFGACKSNISLDGNMTQWQPVTLSIKGPSVAESSETFRNYRLDVVFTQGEASYKVPGFFAADGNAANTSAAEGNVWQVIFTPPLSGEWNYVVDFKHGVDISVQAEVAGESLEGDGLSGSFTVKEADETAPGFFGKGAVQYVGKRYLQLAQSKEWFVKAGAGGPENFLGYADFDSTYNVPGGISDSMLGPDGLHKYEPHLKDWNTGDPTWKDGKGKAIIGAVNYMADKGLNTFYVICNSVNGDGRDMWPWAGYDDRDIYDVSKLAQWDIVFRYMNQKGIHLDFYLWEAENTKLLNRGDLGFERKLYYREILARFGYLPGIRWNISEEPSSTSEQVMADAEYIKSINPYPQAVGVHCNYKEGKRWEEYKPMLGNKNIDGAWMQCHNNHQSEVMKYINRSDSAGHQWVVSVDESLPIHPQDIDLARRLFWDVVTAGGEGADIYFGYGTGTSDITNEDFRNRETMWDQLSYGLELFYREEINALLPETKAHNELSNGQVLAVPGKLYIIYGWEDALTLDLSGIDGEFSISWMNPLESSELFTGSVETIQGGETVTLKVPDQTEKEYVLIATLK